MSVCQDNLCCMDLVVLRWVVLCLALFCCVVVFLGWPVEFCFSG